MKNNKDFFIRYLDNDLSEDEKRLFLDKIKNDEDFKAEYDLFELSFKSLKSEAEVDERYFSNLIPRARERGEKPTRGTVRALRYSFILPILVIGVIFFINYNSENNFEMDYNFQSLLERFMEDEELAISLIEDSYISDEFLIYDSDYIQEIYADNYVIGEEFFDYVEDNVHPSDIDEIFLNNLSEQEFQNIYSNLLEKNIVGE